MRNDIQLILKESGEAGCLALCLVNVAEDYLGKQIEASEGILLAIDTKVVHYNAEDPNDNMNFYVTEPALFLKHMTAVEWTYRHEKADYVPLHNEYVINRYERVKTGAVIGHFDRDNFHPLLNSFTVKYGKLVSKRICKVKV